MKASRNDSWSGSRISETLIVACLAALVGVVAIPGWQRARAASHQSEATELLGSIFQSSATYYAQEFGGPNRTILTSCWVGNGSLQPSTLGSRPIARTADAIFQRIGFAPSTPTYYRYFTEGVSAACSLPGSTFVSKAIAEGDIDEDRTLSRFELSMASDHENSLRRERAIQITHGNE